MTVWLGMPALPPPVLAPAAQDAQDQGRQGRGRRRRPDLGAVDVHDADTDINATLQQIAELTASGCDIVRVACPSQDDADALPAIARKSRSR